MAFDTEQQTEASALRDTLDTIKLRAQFYLKRCMQARNNARGPLDTAYLDGQQEFAQQFLSDILNLLGGEEMANIEDHPLVAKVVRLSDIPARQQKSEMEEKILGMVRDLEDMVRVAIKRKEEIPAIEIDKNEVKYGNFSNRIAKMRKAEKISKDITVRSINNGERFFLVKKV